jgi:hypothetical protein
MRAASDQINPPATERAHHGLSPRLHLFGVAAVSGVVAAAYMLFVFHYAVNAPYEDDWTVVPLVHAALHGQLSFNELWMLHDENRTLVPNLVFVISGVLTHDDIRVLNFLSALTFVGTFVLYLGLFRFHLGRRLPILAVLVAGLLWFSLEGWNNSIWGFQLAWYLVLFFLICMIGLLVTDRPRRLAFPLALIAAVLASFSFVNGLMLWPAGFLCLLGATPTQLSRWGRAQWIRIAAWVATSICTAAAALWGYRPAPLGCSVGGAFQLRCPGSVSTYGLEHPGRLAEFVLVALGQILPNTNERTLWLNGVLGAAFLLVVSYVVYQLLRHDWGLRNCVPLALIAFGLLSDLLIAVARVEFQSAAASSIYTMPNILVLLAVIMYFWARPPRFVVHNSASAWAAGCGVGVLLVLQVAMSVNLGVEGARDFDRRVETGARLVVNLDRIPAAEKGCYEVYGEFVYLLFAPNVSTYPAFGEARRDRLTVFSPTLYRIYRAEGLPEIPQCSRD